MSDTSFSERGHEWPRPYTPEELKAIANSIGLEKLSPNTVKIQQAVEGYQWASVVAIKRLFHRANKERRQQLKEIIKLYWESGHQHEDDRGRTKASWMLSHINAWVRST